MTEFRAEKDGEDADILRAQDLKRVLDLSSSRVVLDVGANIGQFAISVLAEVDCVIHCFEPGKDAFQGLEELSKQERRIIPHKFGIDEVSGVQNLFISESDVGSSLLEPVSGQHSLWATNIGTELVETKRIDELIETLAVPKVEPLCVPINEPVKEPVLTVNVMDVAAEAVVAKDDVSAYEDVVEKDAVVENDELTAFDAVPNNELVTPPEIILMEPDTILNEPVITALPLNGKMVVALFA